MTEAAIDQWMKYRKRHPEDKVQKKMKKRKRSDERLAHSGF